MTRWAGNPWRRFGLSARMGWLVVGVYGVAAVLVVASPVFGWRSTYAARPVDDVVMVLCLVFAAACAGYAARFAAGRRRFGWLALVDGPDRLGGGRGHLGGLRGAPGGGPRHSPGWAEAVFSLYPVGGMASLAVLSHLSRHSPRRLVLDGLIVATSLFVISWVFVLDEQLRADSGSRPATLDAGFRRYRPHDDGDRSCCHGLRSSDLPSRSLLACGIATIAVADIAMVFQTGVGGYHVSGLADLGRVAGFGLMALAGLSSVHETATAHARTEVMSPALLWLPYLPLCWPPRSACGQAVGLMAHGPMLAALVILVAAVLARQFIVLVENQGLLSEVAREAFRDSLTGPGQPGALPPSTWNRPSPGSVATVGPSRCCASTSTTSNRSTTHWGIRPAMSSSSGSPAGSPLLWVKGALSPAFGGEEPAPYPAEVRLNMVRAGGHLPLRLSPEKIAAYACQASHCDAQPALVGHSPENPQAT